VTTEQFVAPTPTLRKLAESMAREYLLYSASFWEMQKTENCTKTACV
jgi:predicted glycosyl hydrolase (DUF1957 family)